MNNEDLKSNLLSAEHWMRLVFMILFAFVLYVAGFVMTFLVIVQFIFALVTGKANANLRQLGDSLSQFIYAVLRFLTYNTDDKPFPFAPWPTPAPLPAEELAEAEAVAPAEEAPAPKAAKPKAAKPKAAEPKKNKASEASSESPAAESPEDDNKPA